MFDLLTSSAWALEASFFSLAQGRIQARLRKGRPALAAEEARPRRYPHVDAAGYPTAWTAYEQEATGPGPGLAGGLAGGVAGVLAGRAGGGTATTSGSKVAVIPVQGTIQKRGGYCSLGTKDLVAQLAAANRDPELAAVVLDIDSPGGQVDGTEELAEAVRGSAKPVVAYIDGLGASAAYWVASQCAHIVINSASTGYAGSLGVLCMSVNQTDFLAKQGVKVDIIRSSRAVDKARLNPVEELSPELRAQVVADLDQLAATFIGAVERGRAGKLSAEEDVFTGKVYPGAAAKKHGLVDAIGSLQDAVNKAAQLARAGRVGASASSFTQNFISAWQNDSPTS